jgi:hypothetical protein
MSAYYGFKYARSTDGSVPQAVRILPITTAAAGGLTVGDPVTVTSGLVKGYTSGLAAGCYGVIVALGRTPTSVAQSVSVGGLLTNFADPSNGSTAFSASDIGWCGVVMVDGSVFKTVYQGATSGTAPTYAALVGSTVDLANATADYSAVNTNHIVGNTSQLGVATFTTMDGDFVILGLASRGTTTTKGVPVTYFPTSGSLTAGDEVYVSFANTQFTQA